MRVIKKPSDPIATRISAGGIPTVGNYCVYRGNIKEAIGILQEAIAALTLYAATNTEPEIDYSEFGGI